MPSYLPPILPLTFLFQHLLSLHSSPTQPRQPSSPQTSSRHFLLHTLYTKASQVILVPENGTPRLVVLLVLLLRPSRLQPRRSR